MDFLNYLLFDEYEYSGEGNNHGKYESLYYISMAIGYFYTFAWGFSFLG